jgi:hypothetical protein
MTLAGKSTNSVPDTTSTSPEGKPREVRVEENARPDCRFPRIVLGDPAWRANVGSVRPRTHGYRPAIALALPHGGLDSLCLLDLPPEQPSDDGA